MPELPHEPPAPPKPISAWTETEIRQYLVTLTITLGVLVAIAIWVVVGPMDHGQAVRVVAAVSGVALAFGMLWEYGRLFKELSRRKNDRSVDPMG